MLSKDQLRALILRSEPEELCKQQLFGPKAWLFQNQKDSGAVGSYLDFKQNVAKSIGVKSTAICIVGSAKLGYSLSPQKSPLLKEFGERSDLDIVIVSEDVFADVWGHFRQAFYGGSPWVKQKHSDNIFQKFIVLRADPRYQQASTYLREISLKMVAMKKTIQSYHHIHRNVNYRIYETWNDALAYHARSFEMLRERLE